VLACAVQGQCRRRPEPATARDQGRLQAAGAASSGGRLFMAAGPTHERKRESDAPILRMRLDRKKGAALRMRLDRKKGAARQKGQLTS